MSTVPGNSPELTISFDQATVELDALQRAVYAVADVMTADITVSGARYVCTLYPRDAAASHADLTHRLRSEVVDQTLRMRIAAQTEPLRNLIFALAFAQTGLTDSTGSPA